MKQSMKKVIGRAIAYMSFFWLIVAIETGMVIFHFEKMIEVLWLIYSFTSAVTIALTWLCALAIKDADKRKEQDFSCVIPRQV